MYKCVGGVGGEHALVRVIDRLVEVDDCSTRELKQRKQKNGERGEG